MPNDLLTTYELLNRYAKSTSKESWLQKKKEQIKNKLIENEDMKYFVVVRTAEGLEAATEMSKTSFLNLSGTEFIGWSAGTAIALFEATPGEPCFRYESLEKEKLFQKLIYRSYTKPKLEAVKFFELAEILPKDSGNYLAFSRMCPEWRIRFYNKRKNRWLEDKSIEFWAPLPKEPTLKKKVEKKHEATPLQSGGSIEQPIDWIAPLTQQEPHQSLGGLYTLPLSIPPTPMGVEGVMDSHIATLSATTAAANTINYTMARDTDPSYTVIWGPSEPYTISNGLIPLQSPIDPLNRDVNTDLALNERARREQEYQLQQRQMLEMQMQAQEQHIQMQQQRQFIERDLLENRSLREQLQQQSEQPEFFSEESIRRSRNR